MSCSGKRPNRPLCLVDKIQVSDLEESDHHGDDHEAVDEGVGAIVDQNGHCGVVLLG